MAHNKQKRTGRRAGSFRTCVGCRSRRPTRELLRVVRAPDGEIRPDLFGKLPGRGARLCPDRACFQAAVERKAFGRAFRAGVSTVDPDALADAFEEASRRQVHSVLATALRSGWLVAGRDAVREAVHGGRAALLLLASDAGASLRTDVGRLQANSHVPAWKMMDKGTYGRFHGGRPVGVVGITHRGLAARLRLEFERIRGLEDVDRSRPDEGLTELTPEIVHGMMPQTQA